MYDILIKNGVIFDGTPRSHGIRTDLAIKGDIITAIKDLPGSAAGEVIDAESLYVAPGFIDIQNHSDSHAQILTHPALESLVAQGITTIVIGQCGASLAPLQKPEAIKSLQKWGLIDGVNLDWQSFGEYVFKLSHRVFGANIASFVGHATLRRTFTGDVSRALDSEEITQLSQLLEKSLNEGAFGASFGFQYAHEINTAPEELIAMLKVLALKNKIFSVHLRSQGESLNSALNDTLEFSRTTGVKTKISHFKAEGSDNFAQLYQALNSVEQAYQSGTDIRFDIYPYATSWHPLYTYLPNWAYTGGFKPMLERIKDKSLRPKLLGEMTERRTILAPLLISGSPRVPEFIGKTVNQVAKAENVHIEEAVLRVLSSNRGQAIVFDHDLNGEQITLLLKHPFSFIASDGVGQPLSGAGQTDLPHPRCFGTFPRFLRLLRPDGTPNGSLMPWSEGIAKITSLPADFLGLRDRGILASGMKADLVIFNPQKIVDSATYENPYRAPLGIEYVINNGKISLYEGQLTGVYAGKILKSS